CFLRFALSCFSFPDSTTSPIYTLSLHDALPISFSSVVPLPSTRTFDQQHLAALQDLTVRLRVPSSAATTELVVFIRVVSENDKLDRKSTRLNSSHRTISYAVFCLKKKKQHLTSR